MYSIQRELSYLISTGTVKALGRELGVDAFFVGSIFNSKEDVTISVRMIEVETGKVIWAGNAPDSSALLKILKKDMEELEGNNRLGLEKIFSLNSGEKITVVTRDGLSM